MKTAETEADVQQTLCEWLRFRRVRYFAVPNGAILGGYNRYAQISRLKRTGLMTGAPDLVLIDRAPTTGRPVVIDVKRARGCRLSSAQTAASTMFDRAGWHYIVAWGFDSGVNQCIRLGY